VPDADRSELLKRRLREINVGGPATNRWTLVLDWYFDRLSFIADLDALAAEWVIIWVRRRPIDLSDGGEHLRRGVNWRSTCTVAFIVVVGEIAVGGALPRCSCKNNYF